MLRSRHILAALAVTVAGSGCGISLLVSNDGLSCLEDPNCDPLAGDTRARGGGDALGPDANRNDAIAGDLENGDLAAGDSPQFGDHRRPADLAAPGDLENGDTFAGDSNAGDSAPPRLRIVPASLSVNCNTSFTFGATGGTPPYTFSVRAGAGVVDSASGSYFSADYSGTTIVRVSDGAGGFDDATVSDGGTALFYIGGRDANGAIADVWTTTDGANWSTSGTLPMGLRTMALKVFENRMWSFGGRLVNSVDAVYSSADGATWTPENALPAELRGAQVLVIDRQLWLGGGRTDMAYIDQIWSSPDGQNWTASTNTLPESRAYAATRRFGGRGWMWGGLNQFAGVEDEIHWTTDGEMFTTEAMTLPANLFFSPNVVLGGRVWLLGGSPGSGVEIAQVVSTANGTQWNAEAPLPGPRIYGAAERIGDTVYFAGGADGWVDPIVAFDEVWSTTDGGTWTPVGTLPGPRAYGSLLSFTPQ